MQAFGPTDFFCYLTTESQSIFFPIRFNGHVAFQRLLNFWPRPDLWGDNTRYNRMGQDRFYCLTNEFITNLEAVYNDIKTDKTERYSKSLVGNMLNAVKAVGIGKYIAITRFCTPDINLTNKGRIQLCVQVSSLNNGKTIAEADQVFERMYKPLFDVYDVDFLGETKQMVGSNKERTCRFCGKKESDGAKFSDEAHAIPRSVGNVNLFCNEECDTCNHEFGEKIETDFTDYFHVNRALFDIKSRSKNVYIGENFCIDAAHNVFVDKITEDEKARGVKQLICKETITNSSMYRAMAKFVINLIDEQHLTEFPDTISWIKGTLTPSSLPPVMMAICNEVVEQPYMRIFTRKADAPADLPYCFAILHCIDLAFLFIMPLALSDQSKQIDGGTLNRVANLVAPFLPHSQWYAEDWSTTEPKFVWRYLDVSRLIVVDDLQAKKNELHMPSSNIQRRTFVDFPPFDSENVLLQNIKVQNYKEYCAHKDLPKEEYKNSNVQIDHSLIVHPDGILTIRSTYACETNRKHKMFDYDQICTFRLKDSSLSMSITDDSISIDKDLVSHLLRQSVSFAHEQLNQTFHQYVQLLPVNEDNLNYALHFLTVYIELPSGVQLQTEGSKLWNTKYLHIIR